MSSSYLKIKDGVKVIEEGQYEHYRGGPVFTHVHLPNSLEIIENDAFTGQPIAKLYGLDSTKLSYIGDRAFAAVPGDMIIGDFNPNMDPEFIGNTLTELEFPPTLESIGRRAFQNSEFLEKVTLPKHVYSIGAGAFAGCPKLETVTVYGLVGIGKDAFPNGYKRKSSRTGIWVPGVGRDALSIRF